MFSGPSFIIRHVRDLDQTRSFYTDVLGYQIEVDAPGFLQFANNGGATLALSVGEGDETELWWIVDNIETVYDHLQANKADIVSPPKDEPFGRTVVTSDPSGTKQFFLQRPIAG